MISITLPSIRPIALTHALRNLLSATRGDLQIVVVSPFRPPVLDDRVEWIREHEPRGPNAAHAAAMERVRGDVVAAWVDDHLLMDGWDAGIEREIGELEQRGRPALLGLRHADRDQIGTVFGLYYPYFPVMRADDAREIGWFDGAYRRGFADADLAMRVIAAGGATGWTARGVATRCAEDEEKGETVSCDAADENLFLRRWSAGPGAGWRTDSLREYNRDMATA